jgi:hypothetical protein
MNKSKTRRQRHRRNKLSRRMKKRGGVPRVPKSIMNTPRSSKITGVKKVRSVRMSSIVKQPQNKRPTFFEPFPPRPPIPDPDGRHTILTLNGDPYTVNMSIHLEKKDEALDRFKDKFKNIQDSYIRAFRRLGHLANHNGRWMFIKAGVTIWDPLTDSFTVYPKVVMSDRDNLSSLSNNQIGNTELISQYNKTGIFCVPETYDLTNHTGLLPSEQFIPPVRQDYYWGQVD